MAVCCNASVSVAELLAVVGSVVPVATATEAVFVRLPVAPAAMFAVNVYVAVPALSNVMVSLMLPVPEAVHVEPLDATQLHVAPDRMTGNVSVTVAFVAVDGPALVTTIV